MINTDILSIDKSFIQNILENNIVFNKLKFLHIVDENPLKCKCQLSQKFVIQCFYHTSNLKVFDHLFNTTYIIFHKLFPKLKIIKYNSKIMNCFK